RPSPPSEPVDHGERRDRRGGPAHRAVRLRVGTRSQRQPFSAPRPAGAGLRPPDPRRVPNGSPDRPAGSGRGRQLLGLVVRGLPGRAPRAHGGVGPVLGPGGGSGRRRLSGPQGPRPGVHAGDGRRLAGGGGSRRTHRFGLRRGRRAGDLLHRPGRRHPIQADRAVLVRGADRPDPAVAGPTRLGAMAWETMGARPGGRRCSVLACEMGSMFGMSWWMWFPGLLVLAPAIVSGTWAVSRFGPRTGGPVRILEERYARGEIDA